jgi:hypothetical protein
MARDFDVDGKWLGDHVKSCQREKCKNPSGILINCFSCQRAFCRACWKIVSKMLPGVKASKGFESCSIEPRPQNPPPQLPGRALLPRGQPHDSSTQSAKLANCLQDAPKVCSKFVVLSDSDDSGNETEKLDDASPAPTPTNLAHDTRSTSKAEQSEQPSQPSKRHFEDSNEVLEKRTPKRPKGSVLASSIPVSSEGSSSEPSFPGPQPMPSGHYFHDGQNDQDKGTRYISEGRYHTLHEWAMESTSLDQQNQQKSMESRPTEVSQGSGMPADITTIEGRGQGDRTKDISKDIEPIEGAGASSTLVLEDRQRVEYHASKCTENSNLAPEIQYLSSSKEQPPGPFSMNSHAGMVTLSCSQTKGTIW